MMAKIIYNSILDVEAKVSIKRTNLCVMQRIQELFGGQGKTPTPYSLVFTKHRGFSTFVHGIAVGGSDVDEAFVGFWQDPDQFISHTLLLAEIPCTAEEVTLFTQILAKNQFTISAIHNHWLFEQPRLFYIHVQALGRAEHLAAAIFPLWQLL